MKKRAISKIENEDERMEVQKVYEECVKRNEDLLMLIELMMNSYRNNKNNFYVNYNLEKFTNFEIQKLNCEIEKPLTEKKMKIIIDCFNNYYLIKKDTSIDSLIIDRRNKFIAHKKML